VGDSAEITQLLRAWSHGDPSALDALTPVVYEQLKRLAVGHMRREGPHHVLQTTALVHEAYLRLALGATVEWRDRIHFFAVSAQIMRRILVDVARERLATKRGGDARPVTGVDLDTLVDPRTERALEMCALNDALTRLAAMDPRRARVVELRYFGGVTLDETAAILNVSSRTVANDWQLARAWLKRELQPADSEKGSG
jgi:RNA polymerase sigma factor (TIGR02999 family)